MTELPPSFLKYVSPERIDVLRNGLLRFSPIQNINDPFELHPTISHLTREWIQCGIDSPESLMSFEATNEDYEFSMDRHEKIEEFENKFHTKAKSFGILSLTGSINTCVMPSVSFVKNDDPRANLLMWSHYADSHTGFIIEFHPDFIPGLTIKNVEYTATRKTLTFEDVARGDESIYFEKGVDWKYENEWRAILPLSSAKKIVNLDNNETVHLFEFDKTRAKSVTLGCRISEKNKNEIVDTIKSDQALKDVSIYLARTSQYNHMLEFFHEIHDEGRCWTNYISGMSGTTIEIQKKPKYP